MNSIAQQYREADGLMEKFTAALRDGEERRHRPTPPPRKHARFRDIFVSFRADWAETTKFWRAVDALGAKALQRIEATLTLLEDGSVYSQKDAHGSYVVSLEQLHGSLERCEQSVCMIPYDLLDELKFNDKASHVFDRWQLLVTTFRSAITFELTCRALSHMPAQPEPEPEPNHVPIPDDEMGGALRTRLERLTKLTEACEQQVQFHPEHEEMIRRVYQQAIEEAKPRSAADEFRDRVRMTIEAIAEFEKDSDDHVRNHPDQQQAIRRAYARAIDRLKEEL